jgi:hypothetical protein
MGRSPDPSAFPHTAPNTDPPKLGDLVFGVEGLMAVCHITPTACTGLLVTADSADIVDVPLDEYAECFPTRVLVKESIHDIDPSSRGH